MKIFKAIHRWFRKLREDYHESRQQKRSHYLDNLSCESINVMEFDGRVYVSYKGVPVVRVEDLKVKTPELLAQSRADYLAWKAKFNA
ncbi:MAG: hypothetical protein NC453_19570 [Muribaculum sp.]|nr:hypothetical protein [Muribaculum sp.]